MTLEIRIAFLIIIGLIIGVVVLIRRTWLRHLPEIMRHEKALKMEAAKQLYKQLFLASDTQKRKIALELFAASRKAGWKEGKLRAQKALCECYDTLYIEIHYHGRKIKRFKNPSARPDNESTMVLPIGY